MHDHTVYLSLRHDFPPFLVGLAVGFYDNEGWGDFIPEK